MSQSSRPNEQNGILPTFKSVHDQPERTNSYAESSQASSSRSAAARSDSHSDNGSQSREGPAIGHDSVSSTMSGAFRKSKRSSGGFLLSSHPNASRLSRSILSQKTLKGKHTPARDDSLSVPRMRSRVDGATSHSSRHGSSPLSTDATKDIASRTQESPTPGPKPAHPDASVRSSQSTSSRQHTSSYGLDTDPAQIVDMALRLNEARRRQASAKRQVSSMTEAKRVVSTATSIPARASPPQPSPALQQLKRKSMNPEPLTPSKRSRAISATSDAPQTDPVPGFSPENNRESEEDGMHISRATLARVAKAQQYFELAYEHRRLLSHLPPLRRPDLPFDSAKLGYDSKTYNPLQYARNRKLRFREKAPINSEADGWHDVDKVRAWVDAVVNSDLDTKHNPLECIRLPPLSLADDDDHDARDDNQESNTKLEKPARPRRPKSDWVTHPGDLIADAYWTEQGLNKKKICNRDNEPIFPPGTVFRFSGWRNRTPVDVPDDLKQMPSPPSVSPPFRESVVAAPELPTFESAHKENGWAKTKSKFGQALKKSSRTKRDQDAGIFDTSSESSSSGESGTDRGQKRLSKKRKKFEMVDGDPFAHQIQTSTPSHPNTEFEADGTRRDSDRSSVEHAKLLKYLRRNSMTTGTDNETSEAKKNQKRRNFLKTLNMESDERGRSSFEYDSTAPGTPVGHGFPSIAINLSPPASRSPSPGKKQKSSLFDVVKDKVQPHKDRTDRADFAVGQESTQSSKRGSLALSKGLISDRSRGTSPTSRGTSPFTRQRNRASLDEPPVPDVGLRVNVNKSSSKTADSDRGRSHRVRGMFKGGRIAELVGTEVSRVGDFIWKREPPRNGGTDSGSSSGYESDSYDSDDEKSPPSRGRNAQLRPALTHSASAARKPEPATGRTQPSPKDSPQYHIQGLPSFTSPFQRDRDEQNRRKASQSPGGTPQQDSYDSDPISTAAKARRMAGKSPRLDRLQPPKLDTSGASPISRRNSYGFGAALDLTRTKSASQLYNDAINGQPQEPATGRQIRAAAFSSSPFASTAALSRYVSNNDQSRSRTRQKVTTQDYERIRALFVAAAVKATNIGEYCEAIPEPQSAFLYEAFKTTGASGPEVNELLPAQRKDEHVIAARHLIGHLHKKFGDFNDHLSGFTNVTTQEIHREMQILEDMTEHTLFPRLQVLSDQAGQLAQKLTTTSTLAVKSVNDEVGEAARMKRRGPYRFGRALGYKLIEWGVVSILWLIWFVVTIVRFGIGTITTIWAIFAWLFFLR